MGVTPPLAPPWHRAQPQLQLCGPPVCAQQELGEYIGIHLNVVGP